MTNLEERITKLKDLDDRANDKTTFGWLAWRLAWHDRNIYLRNNARNIIEELEAEINDLRVSKEFSVNEQRAAYKNERLLRYRDVRRLEDEIVENRRSMQRAIDEMPFSGRKAIDILENRLKGGKEV